MKLLDVVIEFARTYPGNTLPLTFPLFQALISHHERVYWDSWNGQAVQQVQLLLPDGAIKWAKAETGLWITPGARLREEPMTTLDAVQHLVAGHPDQTVWVTWNLFIEVVADADFDVRYMNLWGPPACHVLPVFLPEDKTKWITYLRSTDAGSRDTRCRFCGAEAPGTDVRPPAVHAPPHQGG